MILEDLVKTKKITRIEYLTYLIFALDDLGKEFFKEMKELSFSEETPIVSGETICFHDGRRSVWRTIQRVIKNVEFQMKEANDE